MRWTFPSTPIFTVTLGSLVGSRYLGISFLLSLMFALLLHEAWHVGLTIDEPSHFAAAYHYWTGDDSLQPADTPPLMRLLSGWIPIILEVPRVESTKGWTERDAYVIGFELLGRPGGHRTLFLTRLPFTAFPLLIIWLVWRWGGAIYSQRTGLVLAGLCVFEPTILGHGMLIKSDVPAACIALWFGYRTWIFLSAPTAGNFALIATAVALGVITKFTLLILLPLAVITGLFTGHRLLNMLMLFMFSYIGVAVTGRELGKISGTLLQQVNGAQLPWPLPWVVEFLVQVPWPPQFVRGLLYISGSMHGDGFLGYLNGSKISGWVPEYFPIAFLLKEPIPLIFMSMVGAVIISIGFLRSQWKLGEILALIMAVIFFLAGVFSNFHIGIRHILPSIPFLILCSGAFVECLWVSRRRRLTVIAGGVWLVAEVALVHPNSLSYCNEIAGGSDDCWHHLADSNVDWGQNYPDLASAVQKLGVAKVRCVLFGFDNPWHYLPEGSLEPILLPSEKDQPVKFVPTPGYYAVSVNFLTGLLLPKGHEDFLAVFRTMPVHSKAGYSIRIYKVE